MEGTVAPEEVSNTWHVYIVMGDDHVYLFMYLLCNACLLWGCVCAGRQWPVVTDITCASLNVGCQLVPTKRLLLCC